MEKDENTREEISSHEGANAPPQSRSEIKEKGDAKRISTGALQGRPFPFTRLSGNQDQTRASTAPFGSSGFKVNTGAFKLNNLSSDGEADRIIASTREVEQSFTFARPPSKEIWKEPMGVSNQPQQTPDISGARYQKTDNTNFRQPFQPSKNRTPLNPNAKDATAKEPKFSPQSSSNSSPMHSLGSIGRHPADRRLSLTQSLSLVVPGLGGTITTQRSNSLPLKDSSTLSGPPQKDRSTQLQKQQHESQVSNEYNLTQAAVSQISKADDDKIRRFSQHHNTSHQQGLHETTNPIEPDIATGYSDYGTQTHDIYHESEHYNVDGNKESSQDRFTPNALKATLANYIRIHRQEIADAESRWRNATMEEWNAGKLELMERVKRIVEMSRQHMKRKLAVYQDIYAEIDDHSNRAAKRQNSLMNIEKDAVEKTRELISTLNK